MQPTKRTCYKILIVDDDMILASIYRNKFQQAGFVVDVAESGETGLLKISQGLPDIVLLDLMLGDMNGVEVIDVLRNNEVTRHLPIVVFSSAFLGNLMEDAARAGATKCLNKANCPPNRLVEEVQTILVMSAGRAAPTTLSGPPGMTREVAHHGAGREMHSPISVNLPVGVSPSQPSAPPHHGSHPASAAPTAPGTSAEEIHDTLRRELIDQIHRRLDEAERTLPKWISNPNNPNAPYLAALYRSIRSVAGSAALAGLLRLGQVAGAVEALLKDIKGAPRGFTDSMLRTVCQAVELMPQLARESDSAQIETFPSPLILVLADEGAARATICAALETVMLRAIALDDRDVAVRVFSGNRFDLALIDIASPSPEEIEFCKLVRSTPGNANTPIVFVMKPEDATARAMFDGFDATDFLTKPITPIELAVKALSHLHGGRLHQV